MRFPVRLPLSMLPLVAAALALVAVAAGTLEIMSSHVSRARQVSEELRQAYEVSQRLLQARAQIELGTGSDLAQVDVRLATIGPMLAASGLREPVVAQASAHVHAARLDPAHGSAAINRALNTLAAEAIKLHREAKSLDAAAARLRLWGVLGVGGLVLVTAGFALAVGMERRRNLEHKVRRQASELARAERLASVGFLAAGVAHEINNPLAIIVTEAELAAGAAGAPAETLKIIREEAARCKAITARLLETARGAGPREDIDLLAEAQSAVALARRLEQARACKVRVEGASVHVTAEAGPVRQVLLNLVVNAMEAAPSGTVAVRVSQAGGHARVEIEDDGAGIAPDDLPRIFEPFFTTKRNPATPGLGLGLSVAQAIVSAQGGRLLARSGGPGSGSVFIMELAIEGNSA